MKTFIKCVERQNNQLLVRFREGDKHTYETITFDNYMFIKRTDFDKLQKNKWLYDYVKKHISKAVKYNASNGEFVKLYLTENNDRYYVHSTFLRNNIQTYEGDISTVKRFITNEGPKYDFGNFRVLYLDIETDDRGTFDKDAMGTVIAGTKQMLSVAMEDEKGKQWFYINDDVDNPNGDEEYKMICEMMDVLKQFDITTAWNGNRFDWPYIRQRCDFHIEKGRKIPFDMKLINKLDEMEKYKKYSWTKHERFSLERVGTDTVGEGKVDFSDDVPAGKGRFYNLWKLNKEKLKEYNIKDVTLMRLIDEKFKMYQTHFAVTDTTKSTPEDAMYTSHIADNGLLRLNHDEYYVCDSKPDKNQMVHRESIFIGGGFTFCYRPGFHKLIEVFDYKSHYPLVALTFNMSKETWIKNWEVDWEEVEQTMGIAKTNLLQTMHELKHDKKIIKHMKETFEMEVTEQDMIDAMFEFTDAYNGLKARAHAIENNYVYTPCDINKDTIGWKMHPHRFYSHKKGSFPIYVENAVITRDKSKYIFAQKNEDPSFYQSEEYYAMLYKDVALKIVANGAYGFTGLKSSRFFDYNVADAITTVARWITKKSINFGRKVGYGTIQGDTDSVFLERKTYEGSVQTMDIEYFDFFDEVFKDFNTNDKFELKNIRKWSFKKIEEIWDTLMPMERDYITKTYGDSWKNWKDLPPFVTKNYYCLFEHEKTFDAFISVAKKRYYFLQQGHVKSTGGAFIKNDTNPLAKKLQKALCGDILSEKFIPDDWHKKIKGYQDQCFSNKLDEEYLVFQKVYSKHWSKYGGPMLDSDGNQKKTKDGKLRFKSIPAQIAMVKRLDEAGKWDGEAGDLIKFVIGKPLLINLSILREKAAIRKHTQEKIDEIKDEIRKVFDANPNPEPEDLKHPTTMMDNLGMKYRFDYQTKQRGITLKEYQDGEHYDQRTYWGRITTPLIEILNACDKKLCYEKFGDLWGLTPAQIDKIIESLDNEEDNVVSDE